MARILVVSSQVARGAVGLSIIGPALQALGHEVIALPTVVLSNHPGHSHVAGTRVEPTVLDQMIAALDRNGWLSGLDGLLTGYLPTVEHVAFAVAVVERVRTANRGRAATYLCDPVLGDDPTGLYIDAAAAAAVRDRLLPLADITTPNRFELSYLASATRRHDVQSSADAMAVRLHVNRIVATSVPSGVAGETVNVMRSSGSNCQTRVPLRANAPHGTGDLLSALVLSATLDGLSPAEALAFATAGVDAVLASSAGCDELLVSALPRHGDAHLSWPVETL